MANYYNHIFETPDFRFLKVKPETVFEIGSLILYDGEYATPVSDYTGETPIKFFFGVAIGATNSGDVDVVKVGTSGIYEFECDESSFHVGDLVTFDYEVYGKIHNTRVSECLSIELPIGVVYRNTTKLSSVLVDIKSFVCGALPLPYMLLLRHEFKNKRVNLN